MVGRQQLLKQQREDFIAVLSHNLKSPLFGFDLILECLLGRGQGPLTTEQINSLLILKNSNLELLEMLQKLIEIYRYESGLVSMNFKLMRLAFLVDVCLKSCQAKACAQQVVLISKVQPEISLVADSQAMTKLFNNLLENAIKHTPRGGSVTVEADHKYGQLEIKVTDTGCGISLTDPDELFARFWKGEPGKNYSTVTGLGLYLCRQIVQAHHGRISIRSKMRKGTTCSIVLPKVC